MDPKRHVRVLIASFALISGLGAAYAYDPPAGGTQVPVLPSAHALAQGATASATDAPWADWLNPAASAAQQRPALEASFVALTDFGSMGQGFGGAGSLGISLPTPYAVWGAGLRLVSTPASMTSLPLGTFVEARGSIAKDLFPNFFVGAGLDISGGTGGWGLGLDLGVIHRFGALGILKDFRWGAALTGIGKGYGSSFPAFFPPPFSLAASGRGIFYSDRDLKAGLGLDLNFPAFSDLEANLEASLAFRDLVSLRVAWDASVRELAAGSGGRSLIPSFGLTASIPLQGKKADPRLAKQGWDKADLRPALSFAPLYGGVWAVGLGATMPLGTIDKEAPRIKADFPFSDYGTPGAGPAYVSPNNDGKKDLLEIPLSIKDQRYIVGWTFTVSDAAGQPVRRIYNKESRPETEGITGLWERLVYIKKGVPVPDKLVWNGVADSGQVAPDGTYSVTIEAVDDNGNHGSVGPFAVVVDSTPPSAELAAPEGLIFSPDGDGNKDSLLVRMSGSVEDEWTATALDAAGKAMRTVSYKAAAPENFVWDGTGDDGKVVPDGVYSFGLAATDRAGNSAARRLDGIVINTQQPPIGLVIDLPSFSPDGNGAKDVITLFPSVPIRTGIVSWKLAILDSGKREVWSLSGKDGASLKDRVPFDGRDASLRTLPEGQYQGLLTVGYLNGYSPKATSPAFVLDLTPPSGSVSADRPAFNPAGDPGQNAVVFTQRGVKDAKWTGEILGAAGKVLRTWTFSPLPDPELEWDGTDDAGKPVPDGTYSYRLRAQDGAGNTFASAPVAVSLDTVKKDARLVADLKAFSTAPGSPKPRLTLTAEVKSNSTVRSYELVIAALDAPGLAAGAVVRAWKGQSGVPESFVWDGTNDARAKVPDGRYAARLAVSYQNGDSASAASSAFLLDTVAPSISVSASPLLFSPSETSRSRVAKFVQKSVPGDDWTGTLYGPDGSVKRTWTWKGVAPDFIWEGTDEAGNLVEDGSYRYEVSSVDAAGNRGSAIVPSIVVDKRPVQVFVTASDTGLSPNGDGFKDDVAFKLIVKLRDGIDSWRFALVDQAGVVRDVFQGSNGDVPERIVWEGRDASGAVAQGVVHGEFSVNYRKGDLAEARSADILVSVEEPKALVELTPAVFSPDNDGADDELSISLQVGGPCEIAEWKFDVLERAVVEGAKPGAVAATRVFASWGGTGAPARTILWDGRSSKGELVESATDYPFVFVARDVLGNGVRVEGVITVDVLVIREGDRLKIKVPSIVFRPNGPDFTGLDEATIEKNRKVVARIAQILKKFRDYRIGIVGHANSIAKITGLSAAKVAEEEQKELLPLSLGRAELVKTLLAEYGVDARRLSTEGAGSSQPVVPFQDAENRWKNRRVEFILIKNQGPAGGS